MNKRYSVIQQLRKYYSKQMLDSFLYWDTESLINLLAFTYEGKVAKINGYGQ